MWLGFIALYFLSLAGTRLPCFSVEWFQLANMAAVLETLSEINSSPSLLRSPFFFLAIVVFSTSVFFSLSQFYFKSFYFMASPVRSLLGCKRARLAAD